MYRVISNLRHYMVIFLLIFVAGGSNVAVGAEQKLEVPEIVVYKSETCSCCNEWIAHLEQNNFKVSYNNVKNLNQIKKKYNIDPKLYACHTAIIDKYIVEGHIPFFVINKLLIERPDVVGIATPGMPAGSPGMPSDNPIPYKVYSFDKSGKIKIFYEVSI